MYLSMDLDKIIVKLTLTTAIRHHSFRIGELIYLLSILQRKVTNVGCFSTGKVLPGRRRPSRSM